MKMTIFLMGKQRSGSGVVCPAAATLTGTSGHDDAGGRGKQRGKRGGSTPLLNSDGDGAGRCLLSDGQRGSDNGTGGAAVEYVRGRELAGEVKYERGRARWSTREGGSRWVSPSATRPPPQVERRGRWIRVTGGEGVAAATDSQWQRAVVVFILIIGTAELHVVEAAGAPPAGRVSVGLDVSERSGRVRRRSSLRGEVAAAPRRWSGRWRWRRGRCRGRWWRE
jgi:hypothetical protein